MTLLSKDLTSLLIEKLESEIPKQWFTIIPLQKYISDVDVFLSKSVDADSENLIRRYAECAGYCSSSVYENSRARQIGDCKSEKIFMGLEKSSLESAFHRYLKLNLYSEAIEMGILMSFIGHEFEVFQYEVSKVQLSATDKLFNIKRSQASEKVSLQLESLRILYETVLAPEISCAHIKSLLQKAATENCYINPNVITILERAEENGIKRFRRY